MMVMPYLILLFFKVLSELFNTSPSHVQTLLLLLIKYVNFYINLLPHIGLQ
ncbi:hypothetical protein RchiOBHm_Chr4g0413881 [Rosa chinensis]|uniref:Uncharacterized protein n=1 Tax=Rosa chinensis TaxID=74649 RepID=A0A2P6QWA1_ROSCH|nr:hypothetical protein RchiOBHm_Chr4g0413881 [Rosa chinensis]